MQKQAIYKELNIRSARTGSMNLSWSSLRSSCCHKAKKREMAQLVPQDCIQIESWREQTVVVLMPQVVANIDEESQQGVDVPMTFRPEKNIVEVFQIVRGDESECASGAQPSTNRGADPGFLRAADHRQNRGGVSVCASRNAAINELRGRKTQRTSGRLTDALHAAYLAADLAKYKL